MRNYCLLLLLSVFSATHAWGATYYIDADKGSDSFTGLLPDASATDGPWKTLSKIPATVLAGGDKVLLKCGQVWNETLTSKQSGTEGNPIRFGSYGSCSTPPTITGRNTIPDYVWTAHAPGIWKVQFPLSLISNGNLVSGSKDWGIWSGAGDSIISSDTATCFSGKSAPCLSVGWGSAYGLLSSRSFALQKDVSYTLTFSSYLTPVELVKNGDFPTGYTGSGWSVWSATKDMKGLSGTSCLAGEATPCVTVVTPSGNGLFSSPTFKVTSGETYELKFRAYVPTGKKFKAVVRQNFGPYKVLGLLTDSLTGAGVWQDYTFTFKATASDPTARVDFEIPSTSTLQFKNISLKQPNRATKAIVRQHGGSFAELGLTTPALTLNNGWQDLSYTFTAKESTDSARLDFEVPAGATLQIKDVILNKNEAVTDIVQVFENDTPVNEAHHPNRGYLSGKPNNLFLATGITTATAKNPSGGTGSPYITTQSDLAASLPAGVSITPGLKATIRSQSWSIKQHTITSVSGNQLYIDPASDYRLAYKGWGYYFTGALWMLDSPGEWFYDKSTKTLYVSTLSNVHPSNTVDYSNLPILADFYFKTNISIEGINFTDATKGLKLDRTTNFTLKDVEVRNTADYGIYAEGSKNLNIDSAVLSNNLTDAIQAYNATYLTVTNSDILNSGVVRDANGNNYSLPTESHGAINTGANAVIRNNRIINAAYGGVTVFSNSEISNNAIVDFCLVLSDCGGVYTAGASNMVIANNVVKNAVRNSDGIPSALSPIANGIYMDVSTSASTISGNTVIEADATVNLHEAFTMTISNNTLFRARSYLLNIKENNNNLRADGNIYNNVINGNNFLQTNEGAAVYLNGKVKDTVDFIASMDFNHYSDISSPINVIEKSPNLNRSYTFSDWQRASTAAGSRNLDQHGSLSAPIRGFSIGTMGSNMISNGDLAMGTTYGWGWQGSPTSVVVGSCDGIASKCITLSAGTSNANLISPKFSVYKGKTYRVSFDAKFNTDGRNLDVIVRRAGPTYYDNLLGNQSYIYTATNGWKRYSFTFKATQDGIQSPTDTGARFEVQNIVAGEQLRVTNLEIVPVTLGLSDTVQDVLVNTGRTVADFACPVALTKPDLCDNFHAFPEGDLVTWPVTLSPLQSLAIFTQDSTLPDSDADGIADSQDSCPATPLNVGVNAKGCGL